MTERRRILAATAARISRSLSCLVIGLFAVPYGAAQSFELAGADLADAAALPRVLPRLARQLIVAKRDQGVRISPDNLFRLEIVAGRYDDAARSLAALRAPPGARRTAQARAVNVQYEIYVRAKALEAADGRPFARAFAQAFREAFARLDDRTSALVVRAFSARLFAVQDTLRRAMIEQKGKTEISLADALTLLRVYQIEESYRSFALLTGPLVAEDDRRRYIIEKDIPVRTPDGATVCTMVVRPRTAPGRLPALLEFTIYADSISNLLEARRTASHGYIGITGLTRGKGCSPDQPVPYEHDGPDAAALIDWIGAQAWSDGRVGMYGGSYNGFTQWAAAKRMPKALKAIMPAVPVAPGLDVPMEGNVFWSFVYPWPLYTTNVKALDDGTYFDQERWNRLNREWYVSGRSYRDLDKIDGTPNPIFDRWLDHPSYDAYWWDMIPYKEEFARIDIPVLTTAGYYYGGPGAAVYYFAEHYTYDPAANHYLVIGPYDHVRGQRGMVGALGDTTTVLFGYELDPAAQIDLAELRYQWFDYVFRSGPKPALLKDRVNYEVMGANVWKHAPSLTAMADRTLRFHLTAARSGDTYRLSERKPADGASITQVVDLADRTDVDRVSPGGGIADMTLDTWNGLQFVSDPLIEPTELSGLFSGRLAFVTNKRDFDFNIQLYELTPKGEYVQLSPYWARASYVGDPGHRRTLTPGKRQRLDFRSVRLMSRQFQPGSRLAVVLSVIKQAGRQINYGTGKEVSDETIRDAKAPLTIRWFTDSFIDLPVSLRVPGR